MILSLSHNFLFIHVYKSAGTSIVRALGHLDFRKALEGVSPEDRSRFLANEGIAPEVLSLPGHAFAKHVRDGLSPDVFKRLYKVAFVRNPWDLQLSLYNYNLKLPHLQRKDRDFSSFESFIMSTSTTEFPTGQQRRFLIDDDGTPLVDFVGRFENLEADFRTVCRQIGMDHVQLEHHNATRHDHWSTYYTREMFEHERQRAAADIAAFGYDPDPSSYAIS